MIITEQNVLVDKEINCNNDCFKIGDPQLKFNVIHDERINSNNKQYLIDEFNEHFNKFVVNSIYDSIYDYEKHMSMKWVNASEYNKIASQKELKNTKAKSMPGPFICTEKDTKTQIGCITSIENKSGNRIGAYCFYGIKITCTISEIPERDNNLFIRDWFCKKTLSPKKNLYMNFDSKWHIIKGCFVSEIKDKILTIICDSIEECKEETKFVDSSSVKVYNRELSYGEIAKEFEKSKEEAKNSGKFITTTNQQFPAIKKCIKDILKETIDHASDPSISEHVFPRVEQKEDWREAWYDRYDKD